MYTVVRFTSESLPSGVVERLGEVLNTVQLFPVPSRASGMQVTGSPAK